jgi:hypothetical protein
MDWKREAMGPASSNLALLNEGTELPRAATSGRPPVTAEMRG